MPTSLTAELIENALTLKQLERELDLSHAERLAEVRESLERRIGQTVRPADAARLLGITQPALVRWMKKGDIASVLTPAGRREIPLHELLSFLDDVRQVGRTSTKRPVARTVRERQRASEETINMDRLLPPTRRRGHETADLQSLAYHRLIAERLDERMLRAARRRLKRWRETKRIDDRWADEWDRVLNTPPGQVKKAISANSVRARELRQTSPFAGMLNEQERRRLSRAVKERVSA